MSAATEAPAGAWSRYGAPWEVHKFGGASLNDAKLYRTCGDLLRSESARDPKRPVPTAAVVSAAGGMTDALVAVVTTSVQDPAAAEEKMKAAAQRQIDILLELVPGREDLTDPVIANIQSDSKGVMSMLTAVTLMRSVPPQMLELVAGLGEVWSAQTLMAYLRASGEAVHWIDARDVLIVPDTSSGGLGEKGQALDTIQPLWEETSSRLDAFWRKAYGSDTSQTPFVVVTGFVCSTASGRPTTLKRSGSDYSATIFAKLLGASRVVFWKNVDGVYTADPRRVPDAFSISSMTFDEAMELAYFGGQVLHPSAMIPCIENRIPVLVRNVFNPAHPGTRVYGRGDERLRWDDQEPDVTDSDLPVKAITSIEKVSVVTLSGASFLGTHGVAKRMMEALAQSGVNVILTSQGSSEHSITVAVDEGQGDAAEAGVKEMFALELAKDPEIRITQRKGCSILAVIGEGMKNRPNISGRFFNALGRASVNVIGIAQGSSERNISAVVPREDLSRALRAAHAGFTLSDMTIAVGIVGSGLVGTQLMKQLSQFAAGSRDSSVPAMAAVTRLRIELRAVCDEHKMLLAEHGVPLGKLGDDEACDLSALYTALGKEDQQTTQLESTDLGELEEFMNTKRIPHKVLIDCTASDEVAARYPQWLKRGLHVISPNKLAGAGSLTHYAKCMEATRDSETQWCYESTVGAQMPVISVIHDILQTGDKVIRVEGILSGTMGYIFETLRKDPKATFSGALAEAREKHLTEPDPAEDLLGRDAARKGLIIARELGLNLELSDVTVERLVPESLLSGGAGRDWETLKAELKRSVDGEVAARVVEAKSRGECIRYVSEIDAQRGKISIGLKSMPPDHPLAMVRETETVVSFTTERYTQSSPLVVRGPGAGAVVTATAVFADLLRLARKLGS